MTPWQLTNKVHAGGIFSQPRLGFMPLFSSMKPPCQSFRATESVSESVAESLVADTNSSWFLQNLRLIHTLRQFSIIVILYSY
jgi:hypothetical protein